MTYPRPADEDALADQVSALSHGSFVIMKGQLKHDERVKLGGVEILLEGARGCRGQHRPTAQSRMTPQSTSDWTGDSWTTAGQKWH